MFVSTREIFLANDPAWDAYMKFQGSGDHVEVRTVDQLLNPLAKGAWDIQVSSETLAASVETLPAPHGAEYRLLAINLDEDEYFHPVGWKLLGHDLTDETQTSSLLNCGPWKGRLGPIADRQNRFGLLSRSDAELAQKLLPSEWSENEPHAHVMIWALYEHG